MIRKIKPLFAEVIINTCKPLGLYYVLNDGVYVGIDNSTGHAWTEEFTDLSQCKRWLRNQSIVMEDGELLINGDESAEPCGSYRITITEILQKVVTVDAGSSYDAKRMVSDNWKAGEYILDAGNFVGVEFTALQAVA